MGTWAQSPGPHSWAYRGVFPTPACSALVSAPSPTPHHGRNLSPRKPLTTNFFFSGKKLVGVGRVGDQSSPHFPCLCTTLAKSLPVWESGFAYWGRGLSLRRTGGQRGAAYRVPAGLPRVPGRWADSRQALGQVLKCLDPLLTPAAWGGGSLPFPSRWARRKSSPKFPSWPSLAATTW